MNEAGDQETRARPGLRAAIYARLEEISFRTGLIAATTALVVLSAAATAGVYAAMLTNGSAAGRLVASSVHVTTPAPAPPPRTPVYPTATPQPTVKRPVTAATTQPAAALESQEQAGGSWSASSQFRWRGYGRLGVDGHGAWYAGHGPAAGFGFGGPGIHGPGRFGPRF